ncbi:MAG: hypothetical protein ABIR31_04740 [Ginsengibacter sp.]
MKEEKNIVKEPKLPKGFKFDPTMKVKHEDQPLFQDKVNRANYILKKVGLPKKLTGCSHAQPITLSLTGYAG